MRRKLNAGEYAITSAKQALCKSRQLEKIWSYESRLSQRTLIYIAELLEKLVKKKR